MKTSARTAFWSGVMVAVAIFSPVNRECATARPLRLHCGPELSRPFPKVLGSKTAYEASRNSCRQFLDEPPSRCVAGEAWCRGRFGLTPTELWSQHRPSNSQPTYGRASVGERLPGIRQ